MRALAFALACLLARPLAGCYSPDLAPCTVTCGDGSPCPADLACGSDGFCRSAGDPMTCGLVLTVTTNMTGDGRVTSWPSGIDCSTHDSAPCTATFGPGTRITLSAQRFNGTGFNRWSGDACDGSSSLDCTFTLEAATMVHASFR